MAQRYREQRYGAFVGARVPVALKNRLDALADQEQASLGIVVRRCLEAGIVQIERGGDAARQSEMAEARDWWDGLDKRQRSTWQDRLPNLKGREMIIEAWKQSQGL